jgi:deoxyribodipyrimidine photolyase
MTDMHNRCRMIVASFLSKDLLIDWREGEKYFSQNLVDADVSRALPHAVFSSSTDTPPLGQRRLAMGCEFQNPPSPDWQHLALS